MKKFVSFVLVFLFVLPLASCASKPMVLGEAKPYEITSDIHSLDIRINAADFTIEHGDAFSVESNLKNLTVSEKDGVLTIVDEIKPIVNYTDAMLTLCVPENVVFETVDLTTGAGSLTADSLSANSLKLKLGAGQVQFDCLNAYSDIELEGGAGEITVAGGTLNNLTLGLGVGELNLTAALHGESNLKFGIGESNVTLIGSKSDYKINLDQGVGSISVDGNTGSGSDSAYTFYRYDGTTLSFTNDHRTAIISGNTLTINGETYYRGDPDTIALQLFTQQ